LPLDSNASKTSRKPAPGVIKLLASTASAGPTAIITLV
jgi:hypothetical protein